MEEEIKEIETISELLISDKRRIMKVRKLKMCTTKMKNVDTFMITMYKQNTLKKVFDTDQLRIEQMYVCTYSPYRISFM